MTRADRRHPGRADPAGMRDREGRLRRVGLGADRVEPDGVRFRGVPELVGYLQDYLLISQAELADRCGVRRETVSRWSSGTVQPTSATLSAALAPLGWAPVFTLEPTEAVLDELLARAVDLDELLGRQVLDLLVTVCAAAAEDLDVVVGGEVAAVLQGVPLHTRHLVIHLCEEHRSRLERLAAARWQSVSLVPGADLDPDPVRALGIGGVRAVLRSGAVRTATRVVHPEHPKFAGAALPVVSLAALLATDSPADGGLGPAAREVAGRFTARGG
jgi:transcriptional regulator with XRE-family HTH domain